MSTQKDSIESSKSPGRPSQAACTKYPYATLGQGTSLHPVVEAQIELASGSMFPLRMLPDSGATGTVIPRRYALSLGHDLRNCEKVKVDTGNGIAYQWKMPTPLKAVIAGRELDLRPCFGNIGVPVLGREDFFSEFYVEVDERSRAVIITPHDPVTTTALS